MLRAGTGVAPQDVLNSGLANTTGLAVGTCAWIVAAAILAAAWVAGRRPRLGTFLSSFGIGATINVVMAATGDLAGPSRYLVGAVGLCVIYTGITLLVTAEFGAGPAEELMLALHQRFGVGLRPTRWVIEAVLFGSGWVLGGAVGVGTVVFVVATGPVLAHTIVTARKHVWGEPPELSA